MEKQNQPIISFIIPVLNEEQAISDTVKPLREINFISKEIIVADGGSSDKTVQLAKTVADRVYDRQGGFNKSIAENRNKGASLAAGEILFFLDCNVKIDHLGELLKKVIEIFMANPKIVGLTVQNRFFPNEEKSADRLILKSMSASIKLLNQSRIGSATGWVQIVRKESFWQIGGYNENLITTEDADLFRRLNKIGRTVCLDQFTAYGSAHRYHRDGWPKVLARWLINLIWYIFKNKSYSKKW
jgi:glycosyltransferase involved in cell wall biosynthesis